MALTNQTSSKSGTTTLAAELQQVKDSLPSFAPPEVVKEILKSVSDFQKSWNPASAVQVGQKFPDFKLKDATGNVVSSSDLLAKGPLLVTFYRGEWCPYCNLAVGALQKHLADFKAQGVTLVAITPELPDSSLTMQEKNHLQFPVLSDEGNQLAQRLGIVFKMPDTMRPIFGFANVDLKARNGDDSLMVPIPASYLIDKKGIIRNAFIDPDYTLRLEPSTALSWINALK
jgi:peroxiredoxin